MKKFIFPALVFTVFAAPVVHAQNTRIGFTAGVTMPQIKTEMDNEKYKSDSRLGFNLGIMADIPLAEQFSFQPAFHFIQKGGKDNQDISGIAVKYNVILNYLELPLNFVYRSKGEKGHFIAGLGPSLAYGFSGKTKFSANGETENEKIHFGNGDDDDLKPFDLGGNVLAGYESGNGIIVTFNYNMGLINLSPDSQSKWKNSYFGLRIGYLINQR
jgi:Outer membrane protein beta-barrel domain